MASNTTKIYRPGYVNDFTQGLINDINSTPATQFANLKYQSLNANQQEALSQMMNNPQFQGYVDQLMQAGETGAQTLDTAYKRISDLMESGKITPEQIERTTQQFYSPTQVEEATRAANQISERRFSTSTNPEIAQQTLQQSGFGSSNRLARRQAEESLAQEEQANASDIANKAYSNAQAQAQALLNTNAANNRSALAGLANNASALTNSYGLAGALSQQALSQGVAASQQQLQDRQNQLNIDYANRTGAQNQQLSDIQNKIASASMLNGVLGTTTKTSQSGGSGILGGMVGGAVSGFMVGGPYGKSAY
ncbi:hypothetical protein OGA32_000116 [Salmonella enterica]|nr:hypothetical protein [Salmonella enterica]